MIHHRSEFTYCPHCGLRMLGYREQALPTPDNAAPFEGKPIIKRPYCAVCDFTQYRNPTAGVAVVVLEREKILLGRGADGDWCIPCGHVEWGESVEEAARREFLEETGLQVELTGVLAVKSNFHNPDRQTVGIWYRGRRISGVLQAGSDLREVKFFHLRQPPKMKFPTDSEVIEDILAEIKTTGMRISSVGRRTREEC